MSKFCIQYQVNLSELIRSITRIRSTNWLICLNSLNTSSNFWSQSLKLVNPLTTNVPLRANQLTSFYMRETLVVKGSICY